MIRHWAALNHGRRTVLYYRRGTANRFRAALANGFTVTGKTTATAPARRPDIDMGAAPAMTSTSMTATAAV